GVIFGQSETEDAILGRGEKPIAQALPPGHTGLGGIEAEPSRAKHDVRLAALDDSTQVGDDGRVVLAVRMQHDNDIGTHRERLAVTGLLIAAIPEIALMADD